MLFEVKKAGMRNMNLQQTLKEMNRISFTNYKSSLLK